MESMHADFAKNSTIFPLGQLFPKFVCILAAMLLSGCGSSAGGTDNMDGISNNPAASIKPGNANGAADELLQLFLDGRIPAYYQDNVSQDPFYITELNMEVLDYDAYYSVGDMLDLDNDGEKELILSVPYNGMYLDARDGKVYVFRH